ncbi:MAG: ATP-binding protein [Candidatus Latescibacterota bacterium]|nr:MAG: ATP-binding protein [Candidatus Latescibacterota bacterium]
MEAYEKLGAFYLGRAYDLANQNVTDELTLYDSRDLLTHAFCVGMTGSGKTGLCVGLLEEAAIDGVPALVIDPKGDLANLMLTFPKLSAADFREWIDEQQAERKGLSPDEYAASQAELWRNGLKSWGQTGERIERLRNAAEFNVFTPGSNAGIPVSILDSLAAPPQAIQGDRDLFNERVSTTATSLLTLLGIDADPLKSREHILVAKILKNSWKNGRDLDLASLIQTIENPPFSKIGVLDIDTFFKPKDRFELATTLNNLLASPGFESWRSGVPLDIDQMLYTPTGKPRISIFSIAHLSETERMFFVSMLLSETLAWIRSRPGTTSLRAIVYVDEIFGYIPPVANPPTKKPLLTLLKQARAYGVGVVLATQNPIDLDYKGLSNTGTWFIGRLQTDRDRDRVLDGLSSAAAGSKGGFDRKAMQATLGGLGKRVFLMHNIHETGKEVFHTRWAMSYLRGPMTRDQIKRAMAHKKAGVAKTLTPATEPDGPAPHKSSASRTRSRTAAISQPVLPPGVPQVYLPPRDMVDQSQLVYRPGVIGIGNVHFVRGRTGVEHEEPFALLANLDEDTVGIDWRDAEPIDVVEDDLDTRPAAEATYDTLPRKASNTRSYASWKRSLADTLYRTKRYDLFRSPRLKLTSEPGETERDFRIRLAVAAREGRDYQVEKLRKKYASRFRTLEDRIRRAELAVDREKKQAGQQKLQTAISLGATLLTAFLGRKKLGRSTVGRATTTARGVGRSAKEAQDIKRAQAKLDTLKGRIEELHTEFEQEVERLEDRFDPEFQELDTVTLKPRKKDIDVRLLSLVWLPHQRSDTGSVIPIWT